VARCLNSLGEHSGHRPPGPRCSCGIYALTDVGDGRLIEHLGPHGAIGAVAAWGEMEVHHGGFRAERACVLALADPPELSRFRRGRLQRAAERYGVPLVPYAELDAVASLHASPLPADLMVPGSPGCLASRGIDPDWHVWAQPGDGVVRIGITAPLARELAGGEVTGSEAGSQIDVGDAIVELPATGGPVAILSPVAGRVAQVNPAPQLEDPLDAGWLLTVEPLDWVRDAAGLQWGSAGAVAYHGAVRAAAAGDPFAEIRTERLAGRPRVRDWGDVKAALRALRSAPRFGAAAHVQRQVGDALFDALTRSSDLHPRLRRLDLVVRFRLRDPDTVLVLDLRPDAMRLERRDTDHADVTLTLSAADADDYWRGRLDLSAAIRRGAVEIDGSRERLLLAASVWKPLHARYAEARGPVPAPRAA
jgi:glycine cleavage system H lipoate-binding protein